MTTPPKPQRPLVSLRTFVVIMSALAIAISAGALTYWHKPWIIVGGTAFAAALKLLHDLIDQEDRGNPKN